jgi:tryptophan halogenase
MAYAYHFDAALYAGFLRSYAEARGVRRIEGKIVNVALDPETGGVSHLKLESGAELAGDLFIDCTGFRSLLIGAALETPFEDWGHWLRSDRAIAVPSANGPVLRPYTQSIAHKAGWQWRIPLQHRTGNGHVFSSAYLSEDEAVATLIGNLEGEALAEPRVIRFRTGRRRAFWRRNVIALGLASGFLEPLESTSIHLIQSGISRLLPLLPRQGLPQPVIDEYNRQMALEFDKIRDFIILHYHANERSDSPFWIDCREMDVPDSLKAKMDLFRETGALYHQQEDLFTDSSWLQVMIGQGIYPRSYHPIADRLSEEALGEFLGNIRQLVTAAAGRLPQHEAYVREVCAPHAAAM